MPKPSSAEAFFRRARQKGSENNKDIINGVEIKKELQPGTKRNYRRALTLWHQYTIEQPGVTPNSIAASKDFMRNVAFGIEGKYNDPKACLSSIVQVYKDFTGGWQWAGNEKIDDRVTLSTSNFIKYPLQEELNLTRKKRERCYGTMIHFLYLGTQLWQNDWHMYERPGIRVDVWAEIQLNVFTSARVGEFIESTCRAGSGRGLHYRDVTFVVFRNEHGKAEFAMQVVKDAKGMTFTPDKRPEHSLHEGLEPRPLFCNPLLTHLSIFIAKNVFRDYRTMEELLDIEPPEEEEMFHLQWDPRVLELPLYQKDNGEIDSARVFSGRLRDLGLRAGYNRPPTIHDFRAEGLHLVDKLYSPAQRKRHGGHRDENTYDSFYAPQNPGTDGQGTYFGDTPRSIVNDRFRALTLSRNPELWQSLPAEKQNELENSPEFVAIEEELQNISLGSRDDPTTRDRRKELRTQKRKLVSEELRKLQRLQPRKLSSKADKSDLTGHHRTRFPRICGLMPVRRRLASDLFIAAPIRSDRGRAVLRDMIELYRQEVEVAFRPGLEPEKCRCAAERNRKIDRKPAAQRWKHIYGCYKQHLRARNGFAELCFSCSEWITSQKGWEDHCQAHLDKPELVPTQCNPFNYGGCLASPGYCPYCLGKVTLLASARMRQFLDRREWQDHLDQHSGKLEVNEVPKCPHPRAQCGEAFKSAQELRFHLQDVHCVGHTKGLKRSSVEHEAGSKPSKAKRASGANPRGSGTETDACHKQEFKFIDEAAKLWNLEIHVQSIPSSIGSNGSTPMPDWITDRNESAVETPPSSVCTGTIENIDPVLLASTATPGISDQATIHDFIDGDDFIDINEGKRDLSEVEFSVRGEAVIQKCSVAEESGINNSPLREGNLSGIKLAEEWTSVALDIGDLETKRQRPDTFDAPANLNDTPLDPAPPGSSAASGNKYPSDPGLLFNSTLPQSRCIDSNLGGFVTEPQDDGCLPPASVQENQDIDPSVAADPDDRHFLVERLVRKRVRGKRVQYLVKWQGYPEDENTWEDEKDIHHGLIEIFTAQERFNDSERQFSGPIRSLTCASPSRDVVA